MKFRELKLRRDPACPICGDHPSIKGLIDYEEFCGVRPAQTAAAAGPSVPETTVEELKARSTRSSILPARRARATSSRSAASPVRR